MRKIAQTFFRSVAPAFAKTLRSKVLNVNTQKIVLGPAITAYGLWFSTNKIFNSENEVFETEDNLQ